MSEAGNFLALHRHGFVRVAAATPRVLTGRRRLQPRRDPRPRRAAPTRPRRRPRGLPRALRLVLRDRRPAPADRAARRGRGGDRRDRRGQRRALRRCCSSARRCGATAGSTTARWRSRAGGCSASCRRASCRTTASTTRSAGSPPAATSTGTTIRVAGAEVPFGTDLIFAAERPRRASASTSRSARTSGRAVPPSTVGALGRRDDPRQPLRLEHHHRQGRRAPPALPLAVGARRRRLRLFGRRPGREHDRPRLGRPGRDLRARRPARRVASASPLRAELAHRRRRHRPHPRRAHAHAAPSTTRPRPPAPGDARSAGSRFDHRPRRRRHRPRPPDPPLPLRAQPRRASSTRTATRRSTSRSRASPRRFQATGGEHMVIGVSGGLDSTHALIVAAKVCDRLGLPRYDDPRLHHARLRHRRGDQGQRLEADERARHHAAPRSTSARPRGRCSHDIGHPFADGEPVYDVTFENVQAGLAHRLPVPPRQPAPRLRHRHRRPLRARARLVHLRRRRPDEPLRASTPACRRR